MIIDTKLILVIIKYTNTDGYARRVSCSRLHTEDKSPEIFLYECIRECRENLQVRTVDEASALITRHDRNGRYVVDAKGSKQYDVIIQFGSRED